MNAPSPSESPQPDWTASPAGRRAWWVVLLLAVVIAFAFQGSRGLWESSEGRYAECAREMVVSGDYLNPTLSGQLHLTKPPLTYWAIAAGIKLLGVNAWGARLYLAFTFILAVWVVGLIGRELWGPREGLLAGLIYATAIFPAVGAMSVTTDSLLTLCELAAILAYVAARNAAPERRRWLVLAMWLAWGLAFFTKGPPGLLPLPAVLIWHWRSRQQWRLVTFPGIALFLVVAGWWFVYIVGQHHDKLGYFLKEEVVDRVATNKFGRNPQWYAPITLYFLPLLAGTGPWVVHLIAGLRRGRHATPAALKERLLGSSTGSFLLWWLLIPLLVFAIAKSRLPLYILPLFAPIVLATARLVARRWPSGALPRHIWVTAVVMAALLVTGKGIGATIKKDRDDVPLARLIQSFPVPPNTPVLCYRRDDLYGLEFYLEGRVVRVWPDSVERGDGTLSDKLREGMLAQHEQPTYLFLTRRDHLDDNAIAVINRARYRLRDRQTVCRFDIYILEPTNAAPLDVRQTTSPADGESWHNPWSTQPAAPASP